MMDDGVVAKNREETQITDVDEDCHCSNTASNRGINK